LSQERTEALVLRGVDFSETSRIVTLLTPHRGLVACMVKGVRRPKSPFAASLDTMNRVEAVVYWKDSRNVQLLAEAALLDDYGAVKRDLDKVTLAGFPLELALRTARENEPSDGLFGTLAHGLEQLARWPGPAKVHCCWQVLQLLTVAGYQPELDVCAHCGGALGASPRFAYDSGAVCDECPGDRRLSAEDFRALRLMQDQIESCPPIEAAGAMLSVLRYFAARHLETDFRSMRVIDQMVD
jgi:DNA repair protein RecO (recombination protein O)